MKQIKNVFGICMLAAAFFATSSAHAQTAAKKSNTYLVVASNGPSFTSPKEAIQILEKGILPTFAAIQKLQCEGKIVAGGLPVGERSLIMVVRASSNKEVDRMLRTLPAWGAMQWKVTALESFSGRASHEQEILGELKKMTMK